MKQFSTKWNYNIIKFISLYDLTASKICWLCIYLQQHFFPLICRGSLSNVSQLWKKVRVYFSREKIKKNQGLTAEQNTITILYIIKHLNPSLIHTHTHMHDVSPPPPTHTQPAIFWQCLKTNAEFNSAITWLQMVQTPSLYYSFFLLFWSGEIEKTEQWTACGLLCVSV